MSVAKVLRLEDYRDRRQQRLRLARALCSSHPSRAKLLEHLNEVALVTGADRVGAVWVDEYGPGLVHTHLVLDLLADRPRRFFPAEPLQRAWESGIPGTYDQASDAGTGENSTIAIALGSDGARGWFLVADSVARRAPFAPEARDQLMFLAGECSALVLHRDLDAGEEAVDAGDRFAGWAILQDLEGHEDDGGRAAAVSQRFLIGRLVRTLLEEDLSMSDEQRSDQARRARAELGLAEVEGTEFLVSALDAFSHGDFLRLGQSLLSLGESSERVDHFNGALELYRCAFDLGVAMGEPKAAIDAARKVGRVLRRRAAWQQADEAYETALRIARSAGLEDLAARSLLGMGVARRQKGNLPAARALFEDAREVAERSGNADTLAQVHHDFLGLEHAAQNYPEALRHGWRAVSTYEDEASRTRCMTSLAGVLKEAGDWEAAEDAYLVVAHSTDEHYHLIYAYDALTHLAALRGDRSAFGVWASRCDALGWETGPLSAKAEILYFRALGYMALGDLRDARSWLERAIDFSDAHGFNQVLFDAEAALEALGEQSTASAPQQTVAPSEVRSGLRALRRELAGVEG